MGLAMGDVIQLSDRKRERSIVREIRGQTTAEIMLFTGIRYQRMIDAPLPDATGTGAPSERGVSAKRKRKRG